MSKNTLITNIYSFFCVKKNYSTCSTCSETSQIDTSTLFLCIYWHHWFSFYLIKCMNSFSIYDYDLFIFVKEAIGKISILFSFPKKIIRSTTTKRVGKITKYIFPSISHLINLNLQSDFLGGKKNEWYLVNTTDI